MYFFGGNTLIFYIFLYSLCRRRNKHFDVRFWRIRPTLLPSKDRKDAAYEGRKWMERWFFTVRVGISAVVVNMMKVRFPMCTSTWRVNYFVSRQVEGMNRRHETRIFFSNIFIVGIDTLLLRYLERLYLVFYLKPHVCHSFSWIKNREKSVFTTVKYFPSRGCNIKKHAKYGCCFKGNLTAY